MEHHFLVRYSFTGIVLILFGVAGFWIIDDASVTTLFELSSKNSPLALITVAAATPIIGVALHGLVLVAQHVKGSTRFADRARADIAQKYRALLRDGNDPSLRFDMHQRGLLSNVSKYGIPDDSIFVMLYYHFEESHLIEWARRRRSYHLLGVSWSLAAALGLAFGCLGAIALSAVRDVSLSIASPLKLAIAALIFAAALFWIYAAWWLGTEMKNDADAMELTWSRAFLRGNVLKSTDVRTAMGAGTG